MGSLFKVLDPREKKVLDPLVFRLKLTRLRTKCG